MLTKVIKGFALALSLTTAATATQADDHLYLGSSLGYMFWDDERFLNNGNDSGATLGLNLGYEFAERFAIEGTVGTGLSGPDSDIYSVSLYNFLSAKREGVTPYWLAGLNYVEMDDLAIQRVTESLSAHIGFGLSNYFTENLEFRGDIRASKGLDSDGNLGSDIDNLVDIGLNLALNYHFGEPSKPSRPAPAAKPAAPAASPAPAPAEPPQVRTVTVKIDVLFNTDEDAAISYGSELAKVASAMKKYKNLSLTLEGHTDSRASDAYNQNLSQRRADRVKAKLVNDYQIAASRIKTVGYGEKQPIGDNSTKAGRAKNRRVVGVISWEEVVK